MDDYEVDSRKEWQRQLAGGFAFQNAPFAVHPLDRDRAKEAVALAKSDDISKEQFLGEAEKYLKSAQGWPTDISDQLKLVNKFVGKKLL